MSHLYSANFDNNNTSELSVVGAGFSVSSAFARTGSFSLKSDGTAENTEYRSGLKTYRLFVSFWIYFEHVGITGGNVDGYPLIVRDASDVLIATVTFQHQSSGGGGGTRTLRLVNAVNASDSSQVAVLTGGFYNVEAKFVIDGANSECKWRLGGVDQASPANQNLGTSAIEKIRPGQMGTAGLTNFYYDDVYANNSIWRSDSGDRASQRVSRPRPFAPGLAR